MARRHCLFSLRKAVGAIAPSAVDVLSLCFCAFVCSVTNGPHYGLTLNEMLIDWPVSSCRAHGATAATVGNLAFKICSQSVYRHIQLLHLALVAIKHCQCVRPPMPNSQRTSGSGASRRAPIATVTAFGFVSFCTLIFNRHKKEIDFRPVKKTSTAIHLTSKQAMLRVVWSFVAVAFVGCCPFSIASWEKGSVEFFN